MTNGDRIRGMTDGELAMLLADEYKVNDCLGFRCPQLPECDEDIEADRLIPLEWCAACLERWLGEEADT